MLTSILKKEFLLVGRDIHALAVLFIMPTAFILIMSLSLQDKFADEEVDQLKVALLFEAEAGADDEEERSLKSALLGMDGFEVSAFAYSSNIEQLIEDQSQSAVIKVSSDFLDALEMQQEIASNNQISVVFAPRLPSYFRELIQLSLLNQLGKYQAELATGARLGTQPEEENPRLSGSETITLISVSELFGEEQRQPNSVEQTVPAWLIFAMFFVVIPLSTTFLNEKQQGTLQRLKTTPAPSSYLFIGKFLPYLVINLVQTILMFLVGIVVVPLLGGDGIQLQADAWLLLPMSAAVSFAAISFALLVAVIAKTTEQATTIGGVSNLIFAAIGGIMVPTFVMPEVMQGVAQFSPMNWGLEGYLSIILRQASLGDIASEIVKLAALGVFLFSASVALQKRSKT